MTGNRPSLLLKENAAAKLLRGDDESLSDRELLESLLTFAMTEPHEVSRRAKELLGRFGNMAETITEEPELLQDSLGLTERTVLLFRLVQSAAVRLAREDIAPGVTIGSVDDILFYCRVAMSRLRNERFRVLFLNKRNILIADEIQQNGSLDHVAVYPRDLLRRALILNASSIILVHNHPSGDPTPSPSDFSMTQRIVEMAKPLGIHVLDHLIISRRQHVSFRQRGLLREAV